MHSSSSDPREKTMMESAVDEMEMSSAVATSTADCNHAVPKSVIVYAVLCPRSGMSSVGLKTFSARSSNSLDTRCDDATNQIKAMGAKSAAMFDSSKSNMVFPSRPGRSAINDALGT